MKNTIRKFFSAFALSAISIICFAQQQLKCGNGPINYQALNEALQYESMAAGSAQAVNYLVRVYFHVFRNDDGTNSAATEAQINNELASLQASYAADNVCFLYSGLDFINSTALNQNFNADTDSTGTALSSYQVPGCINIFYMRKINGNNTACNPPCGYGGIALGGIPGTFFLMATVRIASNNVIGHEMGHSLGLLHTFEKAFGLENINGTNASTAGDKITDTPADPFAYNGTPCFTTTATKRTYTGTCTDPNMQTGFTPPYLNIMSYWDSIANPLASNGQFVRANSFLNSNAALINCSSPGTFTQNAIVVSTGHYMKSAINAFSTTGSVVIQAGAIATLGGQTVILSPGFRASPTGSGRTYVRLRTCN